MRTPVLSIIIPVYNVSKYVEKCIRSCYNQNALLSEFEIIAVNDGSTDDSLEICEKLQSEFSELKIISQENKGLSGARNTGLKHAQGEYIWFVDSDDWIKNASVEVLLNEFAMHKVDLFWIGHDVIFNEKPVKQYIPEPIEEPISGETLIANHLNQLFYIWKFIYKRTFLIDNNLEFKEGILFEDLEFTPRVLLKSKSCFTIPRSFYNYLIRSGSIANIGNIKNKTINDRLIILSNIIDLEQSPHVSKTYSKALQPIILDGYVSTIKMSARGRLKLTSLAQQVLDKIRLAKYEIKHSKRDYALMNISLTTYHYFYKSAYTIAAKLKRHE
jgi:glycosyltransferase involved in cell wall biosynthesis